jgi:thiol-disulfide isomerase/thioredoxin
MILKAAALAGRPEEALKFRAAIEEAPPSDKNARAQYWTNRARFAALDKRPQDAIVYYRLALDSRTHQPEYNHGLLRDELMTEFHDLWKAQGGTEAAWLAWNPPAPAASADAAALPPTAAGKDKAAPAKTVAAATTKKPDAQGDWKNAPQDLPLFELSDFSGKAWRLKDLQGKVVMITTWATWCEWCRLEDQYLERFYEKEKDRKDLAILTFDLDENPGQVLPFMKQQGYTFPVLAAFSIPDQMTNLVPRTWIIDPAGHWLWVKNGYDDAQVYSEFEKEMLDRIERAKAAQ